MSARWMLLAILALAACAASSSVSREPVLLDAAEPVAPEFLPALEALEQAVRDGDELVARGILESLYARRPEGRALEVAQSFERILDGRALVRDLELRLEAHASSEKPGEYAVALVAAHRRDVEVRLRAGAARLRQVVLAVSPDGAEQRSVSSFALDELGELVLPPGRELRVELALVDLLSPPDTLAQRSRVELELLLGELRIDERVLPAQQVPVAPVECVRIASYLPRIAVEPAELVRYVLEERVRRPALMERAVRIASARRAEALDLVARRLDELSLLAIEDLVPALRWLSGADSPGGDPEAWRAWLAARAERRELESRRDPRSASLSIPDSAPPQPR